MKVIVTKDEKGAFHIRGEEEALMNDVIMENISLSHESPSVVMDFGPLNALSKKTHHDLERMGEDLIVAVHEYVDATVAIVLDNEDEDAYDLEDHERRVIDAFSRFFEARRSL